MDEKPIKMQKTTKIFISYKTGVDDGLTYTANSLRRELYNEGYIVWMDDVNLEAGLDWNSQIYENVSSSDILLMLLGNTTANSDWVRREIDVARGAKVRILPVLIRDSFDKQESLNKFDLPRTQYVDLLKGSDDQFKKLLEAIKNLEGKTLEDQEKWLKVRAEKNKGTPITDVIKEYATFRMVVPASKGGDTPKASSPASAEIQPENKESPVAAAATSPSDADFRELTENPGGKPYALCKIHVAVGDITQMRDIDVFVNSENAYLQMARIFESKTVSALLRYYGSYVDEGGSLAEDTVQRELDAIVENNPIYTRPVGIGTVIATSAGHPCSILRTKNNARFIFHAVTVSVEGDGIDRTLKPAQSHVSIRQSVVRTLEKIVQVNGNSGVVSEKGTGLVKPPVTAAEPAGTPVLKKDMEDERTRQDNNQANYQPIKSIILPLYASGHGGRNAIDVMPAIVEGIRDFLNDAYQRGFIDPPLTGATRDKNGCEPGDIKLTLKHLKHIYLCVYHKEYVEPMREALRKYFDETEPPTQALT